MAEMQMTPEQEAKMRAMRGQKAPQAPEEEPQGLSAKVVYLLNALRNWRKAPEGDEAASKDVAEGASMMAPGRGAVLQQRARMRALDEATKVE